MILGKEEEVEGHIFEVLKCLPKSTLQVCCTYLLLLGHEYIISPENILNFLKDIRVSQYL